MSTTAHPETDDQTERAKRVMEDMLRSYASSYSEWSTSLPLVEFALNNSVHRYTDVTPFFANYARHPHVPITLSTSVGCSTLVGGESTVTDDSLGALSASTTPRDLTAQKADSFNEIQDYASENKKVNIRDSQLTHMVTPTIGDKQTNSSCEDKVY